MQKYNTEEKKFAIWMILMNVTAPPKKSFSISTQYLPRHFANLERNFGNRENEIQQ